MALLEELRALGADVDEGLERVVGDKDLYVMMLGMFADTAEGTPIALEEFGGPPEPLIEKVHKLKGAAGNLSLTPVFQGLNRTLELLRGGRAAEAREAYAALLPVQDRVLSCIRAGRT